MNKIHSVGQFGRSQYNKDGGTDGTNRPYVFNVMYTNRTRSLKGEIDYEGTDLSQYLKRMKTDKTFWTGATLEIIYD